MDRFLDVPHWTGILLIIGASWRIAFLFVYEGGPFSLILKLRTALGFDHAPDGDPLPYAGGFPGTLFACVWCMAFWTAIIAYVVWMFAPYIIVPLGIWAGASIANILYWILEVHLNPRSDEQHITGEIDPSDPYGSGRNGNG